VICHTFHFFRDRVARFTGEGDFLGDDGTATVFFAPRFGAGDFLAGDGLVFLAVFLGSGDLGGSAAVAAAAAAVFFPPFFSGLLLPDFCPPRDLFFGDSPSDASPAEGERFRLGGDATAAAAAALPRPLPRLAGVGAAASSTTSSTTLAGAAAAFLLVVDFFTGLGVLAGVGVGDLAAAAAARPLLPLAAGVCRIAGALLLSFTTSC